MAQGRLGISLSFTCCTTTPAGPAGALQGWGPCSPAQGSMCPVGKRTGMAQQESDGATLKKIIFSPVSPYSDTFIKCFSPPTCVHPLWLQNPQDPATNGQCPVPLQALRDPKHCLAPAKNQATFYLSQASWKTGWDFSACASITVSTIFSCQCLPHQLPRQWTGGKSRNLSFMVPSFPSNC